jgi:putative hydrolase of the HAD superfamily
VRNDVVLYDDVRPALDRLHAEYRLFAISNGNANLRAIGLDHYFEATLAARDAGTLKPDPRMFEILLQRAGLHAHDAAHVGDDPEADVEGARAAGLLPVWLNRVGSTWTRESPAPRVEIASLDELPKALHQARPA